MPRRDDLDVCQTEASQPATEDHARREAVRVEVAEDADTVAGCEAREKGCGGSPCLCQGLVNRNYVEVGSHQCLYPSRTRRSWQCRRLLVSVVAPYAG